MNISDNLLTLSCLSKEVSDCIDFSLLKVSLEDLTMSNCSLEFKWVKEIRKCSKIKERDIGKNSKLGNDIVDVVGFEGLIDSLVDLRVNFNKGGRIYT